MKRKLTAIILTLSVLTAALAGCSRPAAGSGSSTQADSTQSESSSPAESSTQAESSEEQTQAVTPVTLRLGVVGSMYEELWEPAQNALKQEGIDLKIVQFSDYVTPNNALANGELDLNAFQHRIYLQNEINSYGYDLTIAGNTFIIPLNLYSQKVSSVEELKDGDIVAIPDDVTNGGRALKVLEAAGLIELKEEADINPTVDDIETYNVQITIKELKANIIPSTLPDVTAGIINGNYALDFGLKTEEAIYADTVLDVKEYWNLIAVRTDDLSDPEKAAAYEKVVAAFQSSETERVFKEEYGGYFIKVGWDEDLLAQ